MSISHPYPVVLTTFADHLVLDPRKVRARERYDLDVAPDYLCETDSESDEVVAPSFHEAARSVVAADYQLSWDYLLSYYFWQFISPMLLEPTPSSLTPASPKG